MEAGDVEMEGLDRVRLAVLDPLSCHEEMIEKVEGDVIERVDALKRVLASLKSDRVENRMNGEHGFEFIEDEKGKRKVFVDVIDEVKELREFNNIENPVGEYENIVFRDKHAIQQLRQALASFQVQPRMERGSRKGIVCTRDLARVVSSKGKFDKPFMSNHEKAGASLLILVDESMSMSQEDMINEEDDDYSCPMKETCYVMSSCDVKDDCDDAGLWPKDDTTCHRCHECPMHERSTSIDPHLDDGEAHSRIHLAKKSTIILAEALKNTRIDFAVIGFSAMGGQNKIVEKNYKAFNEPVNPHKMGSIWVSETSPENRDGTSMLVARRHFKALQNRCPIMIVISDGEPYHGGTDYVGETAVAMTSAAVNAVKQSVRLFALSIDKQGENYLERIYGKDHYFVVKQGCDVTRVLVFLVKSIAAALRG